ncbi:monovalent cation/H+ antiporter subunit D family protein [Ihubacter sp. mB4P-1]|uniref:monovalent cation/H+ antiporter subunit D family protein n=1 Tax=Ihubacter sp. mB4P-1 TaxID=3242370 RepID=UPI00137A2767
MTEMLLTFRPVIAILISMIAAGAILVAGERVSPNIRESITMAAAILKAICVFSMIPAALVGNTFDITLFEIVEGVGLSFRADSLGMVFACVASGLWILTSIYSIGYMRGHDERNQTGYFSAFAMSLSSAIGICFSANLLTFFIFYEMLTAATYPLVVHYRDEKGKRSGRKYLLYTLTSGQLFFAAIVYVYMKCGTLDFTAGGFITGMTGGEASWVFFLMILGGVVKAGVMPLHSWLPAAMVAPTPVSALLHAVAVVKAGAFCVIRVICYTFGPDLCQTCGTTNVLAWFAVGTILLSSLIAIQKDNLKARLAFSTVGQLSYIVLGVCVLTPISVSGAIYHIVAHALMKITLFMCAGAIFVTEHKADVSQMRGIGRRMPLTMTAFAVASLGIAGMPFMVGFVSKAGILQGAAQAGQPLFIATLVASALLSLTYLIPVVYMAFSNRNVNSDFCDDTYGLEGEASKPLLCPLLITAFFSVLLGICPDLGMHLMTFAQQAAAAIFEGGGL